MDDCIFCNIAQKNVASEFLYENERLIVIRDILPKAPVHLLVISKEHIPSVSKMTAEQQGLVGEMVFTAKQMAEQFGVSETGYKLVYNVGRDGGQVIPHLHLHLLGGKNLGE